MANNQRRKKNEKRKKVALPASPPRATTLQAIEEVPYPAGFQELFDQILGQFDTHQYLMGLYDKSTEQLEEEFSALIRSSNFSLEKIRAYQKEMEANILGRSKHIVKLLVAPPLLFIIVIFVKYSDLFDYKYKTELLILNSLACIYWLATIFWSQSSLEGKISSSGDVNKELQIIFDGLQFPNKNRRNSRQAILWENCRFDFSKIDRSVVAMISHTLKRFGYICFKDDDIFMAYRLRVITRGETNELRTALRNTLNMYDIANNLVISVKPYFDGYNIFAEMRPVFSDSGAGFKIDILQFLSGESAKVHDVNKLREILPLKLYKFVSIEGSNLSLTIDSSNLEVFKDVVTSKECIQKRRVEKLLGKPAYASAGPMLYGESAAVADGALAMAGDAPAVGEEEENVGGALSIEDDVQAGVYGGAAAAAPDPAASARQRRQRPKQNLFPQAAAAAAPDQAPQPPVFWSNPHEGLAHEQLPYWNNTEGTLKVFGHEKQSGNDIVYYGYLPSCTKEEIGKHDRRGGMGLLQAFLRSFNNGLSNGSGKFIGCGITQEYKTFVIKIHGAARIYASQYWDTTDANGRIHRLVVFDVFDPDFHKPSHIDGLKNWRGAQIHGVTPETEERAIYSPPQPDEVERTLSGRVTLAPAS